MDLVILAMVVLLASYAHARFREMEIFCLFHLRGKAVEKED